MKFTDMLESQSLEKIGQKIAKLIQDSNDHNQASIEAATLLKDKKTIDALKGIQSIHLYKGSMSKYLTELRNDIMDKVHTQGRKKFKDWDENIYQNL